jgi:hypothetical protein
MVSVVAGSQNDSDPTTSSSQNSSVEIMPSTAGRRSAARSILGFSWMGVSLSANDGSVQFSSQPSSLPSHKASGPNDDNSSVNVSTKGGDVQLD